jgi:hypothetical protein
MCGRFVHPDDVVNNRPAFNVGPLQVTRIILRDRGPIRIELRGLSETVLAADEIFKNIF